MNEERESEFGTHFTRDTFPLMFLFYPRSLDSIELNLNQKRNSLYVSLNTSIIKPIIINHF